MNSDDDPRAIDWAPKKIRAIELDLANLRTIFGDDRKVRERGEQNMGGRIYDLEQAVARIEERHRELVKQSADEIETLTDRVNELQNAIASKVRDELSEGFRELEIEPEYSPPIGQVFGERRGDPSNYAVKRSPENTLSAHQAKHGGLFALGDHERGVVQEKILGAAALRDEAFGRGYSMGVSAAIDEAESRVMAALDRAEVFNPSTRRRILDALRRTDRKLLGEKGPIQNSGS